MAEFYRKRKKICMLCAGKKIKYNEPETLKKYINEKEEKFFLEELQEHVQSIKEKLQEK